MRAISLFRVAAIAVAVQLGGSLALSGGFVPGFSAEAASPKVTVIGNSRVDKETVISYLKLGDIDASIKALYATNLFSDVKISRGAGGLVVTVKENPVIMRVIYEGNSRQDDASLNAVVELQPRSMLTQAKVQSDTQRILDLYRHVGRYNAQVTPQVIDRGENRVDLVYKIVEGPRTEVTRISFVGNKAFGDGRLKDVISTEEAGLLSWLKNSSNYDPDRLNADREALRVFYINHGYADARIVSSDANFDQQANSFYVTFTIDEGAPYKFGKIGIESTLKDLDVNSVKGLLKVQEGDTYNASAVDKSVEQLTMAVAKKGYAFVQVRPRADRDFANHVVGVNFYIDEGPRAYIERIDVVGNTRTRDFVIRREFDVAEGDAYNQAMMDRAQRRLQNLGYFKSVKITESQGSAPDKVIVTVKVEDQPTGEVSIGAGYSTAQGFIAQLSFSEKNFLGRGQKFKATISRGISNSTYSGYEIAFTEPYLFDRRLSLDLDVYRRTYTYTSTSIHPYDEQMTGGSVGIGVPIMDDLTFGVSYALLQQRISNVQSGYTNVLSNKNHLTSSIGYNFTYNTIDNYVNPHEGYYARFEQRVAGLGGDARYLKTTVDSDVYKPLYEEGDIVGHLSFKAGHMVGLGRQVDVLDQFHLGGEVVRGFDTNGFGPRDTTSGYQVGGRIYAAASAETIFPLPFVPKDLGMKGAFFADAGVLSSSENYSGTTITSNSAGLRASVGTSLIWQSPLGMIRADVALPVVKNSADNLEYFKISGGTKF